MSEIHKITTVEDILNLPPEKREACCRDLLTHGRAADVGYVMINGWKHEVSRKRFLWVDDGSDGEISGIVHGGEVFELSQNFKPDGN